MAEVRLQAIKRNETGKGSARRSRAEGKVPGVVYGHGMDPLAIEVDRREFVTALHTDAGMNVLLDLEIDGSTTLALTRELQRDPVRGTLLHADFVQIDRDEEVEVEVHVVLTGDAPGVAEGGVLEQPMNAVLVRSKATEVPDEIEADISGLAIGDSLKVADLTETRSYEILTDEDTVLAAITAPVSEAELEALEAEAGVVHEETDVEAAEAAEAEGETEDGDAKDSDQDASTGGDES
ncbi:MAG: 50S ribosomal protein L25/general stress protein Ctc [Actinobacteria bacterium]|nr:50S ribosomal protein L25/general stress protein Ctc [Actinomycetota bacterium]